MLNALMTAAFQHVERAQHVAGNVAVRVLE